MKPLFFIAFFFNLCLTANARTPGDSLRHKVAVIAPLYLDAAFTMDGEYKYPKKTFPKSLIPGLDFYQGVRQALDSFTNTSNNLEVFIIDSKSQQATLEQQLASSKYDHLELIIAYCTSGEVKTLADYALKKNVPVINATVPNDIGISANPFFTILNPTLRTQCEGIYKHLQQNYATHPVVVFRKPGTLEDQIKNVWVDYSKHTTSVPLNIEYVDLTDSFSTDQVRRHLDSNMTVCISGSLEEKFGRRLATTLESIYDQYPTTLVGMPTWDGMSKSGLKNLEIIYPSPFYRKSDRISQALASSFSNRIKARASDMYYRGYEVTYKFLKLLITNKGDLASNLSSKKYNVFTDFDIQPVIRKNNMTLDYFENKKLYFIKWQDGSIKSVQ